jgi:hypothetical protein
MLAKCKINSQIFSYILNFNNLSVNFEKHLKSMRRIFTHFFCLLLFSMLLGINISLAQTLQSYPSNIANNLPLRTPVFNATNGLNKSSSCAPDTVNYVYNKTTVLNTISLNNATSGNSFAQWYPSPQAITIYGFEFFAWQTALSSAVVSISCKIFNAGIDSMPAGTALATVIVPVDSSFGGGVLTTLRKKAIFSTPVTTSSANGYVLVIETSSATNVAVVTNSWNAVPPNGRSEWLSSVKIGTNFIRSYNINIGTTPFNADFIIQPFVSYNLVASFTSSTNCIAVGSPITFTNTSSPVLFSKYYNIRAFFNIPQFSCLWDYGDTTGGFYSVNGSKTYNYNNTYRVKLLDTLYGWTTGCGDTYVKDIYQTPDPSNATNNSPVCAGGTLKLFADSIPNASYIWTGPNGFGSNQRNPEIAAAGIAATGLYSVQTVIGQCSSSVTTTYASVVNTYFASNNGPLCAGQNLSLNATEINGATYSWTGPNGFSSTQRNPLKTAATTADSGTYQVSITMVGCGSLGPFSTLAVVNANPAAPTASSNGPLCVGQNLNLSASAIGSGAYIWSGPNNFTSFQQNPVRPSALSTFAGSYQVVFTKSGCTSPPANVNVVINNIPNAPTVGNNGPLCAGQILSLTASLISGATYTWSGPNNFTETTQNPTRDSLTLIDAGIYSVVATVNGCASPAANTTLVITNSTPTPTANNNGPLCPGQNLQLTATGMPGATFSWVGPKGFSSTQQNPVILNVNDSNAGIYSVTASTTACGTSSAANTTLSVNALPAAPNVGNNSPVCETQNLELTASPIAGATYFWNGPNGYTSNLQNPVVSNMSKIKGGTYSVYVTVAGCGTSSTSNSNALVRPMPTAPNTSSNSPVCFGDSMVFNSNNTSVGPNANYAWTGPNNFSANGATVKINSALLTDAGLYQVHVSDSGCTSSNSSLNVLVKNLPAAPVPSSNAPICAGVNLNLQATNISGATYVWSGPDDFKSNAQNPGITGTSNANAGLYFVRSLVNGCYSIPASLNVMINPLPTAPMATNTGPACVGDNVSLKASNIAGASYNWSGPNFNSNLQNPILVNVTKSMGGTYAVSAILNGCTSLEEKTDVKITAIPNAPILSSFPASSSCTGDSLRFFANNVKDGEFDWVGPLGFSSSLQSPVLYISNTAQAGIYSATVSVFGCVSTKSDLPIQISNTPNTSAISGLSDVNSGETNTFSVSGLAGSSYAWTVTGGTIQSGLGTASISIKWGPKGTGNIKVIETSASNCKGVEQSKNINIGYPLGIGSLQLNQLISLYPNPANKYIILHLDLITKEEIEIQVLDLRGRLVNVSYLNQLNHANEIHIGLNQLDAGIYFMKVKVGQKEGIKKFQVN